MNFWSGMAKIAQKKHKMPHYVEQDRPEKSKEIYTAMTTGKDGRELRERYGKKWKEVAARVATRQGKSGKQHQGPPYKDPI